MATEYHFGNKTIKLPGAYAETKARVASPVAPASYSKVLIVDTGSNAGWGNGSGVNGTLQEGKNSVYSFTSPEEMKSFVKGGPWYNLADNLFKPSRARDVVGVSEVVWVSARQSTPASITIPFVVNDDPTPLVIKVKDEGTFSNGVEFTKQNGSKILTKGYAVTAHLGIKNPAKLYLKFWVSTYTGLASDNFPFDEVLQQNALPEVVCVSPEFSTLEEVSDWMISDYDFGLGFVLQEGKEGTIEGLETLVSLNNILASGGTETYASGDLDDALVCVQTKDTSFVLCDLTGASYTDAKVAKLQFFCQTQSRFKQPLVFAGGNTRGEFTSITKEASKYLNSDLSWAIHGSVERVSSLTSTRKRTWSSLTHAALILGRIAGNQPQVPATFKEIDILGLSYDLNTTELEECLDFGILTSYYDEDMERYNILKGVNTLQNNKSQINPDGTTPSIQIKRISDQINKELVLDSKKELFTQREGVTVLTVSPIFLEDWTIEKLKQKIDRGMIVDYSDVKVQKQGDAYFVSYQMRVAEEINFFFNTGYLIN